MTEVKSNQKSAVTNQQSAPKITQKTENWILKKIRLDGDVQRFGFFETNAANVNSLWGSIYDHALGKQVGFENAFDRAVRVRDNMPADRTFIT